MGTTTRPKRFALGATIVFAIVNLGCLDKLFNEDDDDDAAPIAAPSAAVTTGVLDPAFGAGGVVQENPSGGGDRIHGIARDATSMYLVGMDFVLGRLRWRIEKRSLATGALDGVFGGGTGIIIDDPGGNNAEANAIAIDGTFMYVVGYMTVPAVSSRWLIEKRRLDTGALDAAFGVGGRVESDPSGNSDTALDIAIDGTFMYVAGGQSTFPVSVDAMRVEKRTLATGAAADFGAFVADPTAGSDYYKAIVIDATSMYLAGHVAGAGLEWRIEKRNLVTAAADGVFGGGTGIVTESVSAGDDTTYDMASDGTSLYIVGRDRITGNDEWRVEKRSMASGLFDGTFAGGAGAVTFNLSFGSDEAFAVAFEGTSLWVAGSDNAPGNDQFHVEKLSAATGASDLNFGPGGFVASDVSAGQDRCEALAVDGTSIYVAGFDNAAGNDQWRVEKRSK